MMADSLRLRRCASWLVISIMAIFGFTGLASADSISDTGPYSRNIIRSSTVNDCTYSNENDISIYSSNNQTATSGNATSQDNTNAYWQGWSALDPALARANGESFSTWQADVTNWVSQHGDANNWNSTNLNLSWTPSGSDWQNTWSNWDPMFWQANGQSFTNWYSQFNTWVTNNTVHMMLNWTGDNTGGVTTGNATNTNNVSFAFNISNGSTNNSAETCGSLAAGGGGGTTPTAPSQPSSPSSGGHVLGSSTAVGGGGGYSGYGGNYSGTYHAPANTPHTSVTPSTPPVNVGGGGGSTPVGPSSPSASISDTGPNSTNVIASSAVNRSTTANCNDISVSNTNVQTASSGSASSSSNTNTGSGGSGNASNANGAGGTVKIGA